MKLLIISPHFPAIFGGVSDYTYHLSKTLAEKDMDVYVLTSKDQKVIRGVEGLGDEKIGGNRCVKVFPVVESWGFRGLSKIVREIKKISPDRILLQYVPYMYSNNGIPLYIALLFMLLRLKRHKLFITFHEIAVRLDFKKPRYWGIGVFQRLIAYIVCIVSNKIVISAKAYRKTIRFFNKKIYEIPIGSNILPINISEDEKKALRRKIAPSNKIIISTFGAGARRNDLLIRVMKRLKDENFSIKLLMIGKFPEDWVQKIKVKNKELELDEDVYFTGFLKSEEVYRYLSISDLFVLLEDVDCRGLGGISIKNTSLIAAFAAGLPILGNRGHMTDNFFSDKKDIILIDCIDEETVSGKIKELLDNPLLLENLKRGATKTYEAKLSWSVIANKYKELIWN